VAKAPSKERGAKSPRARADSAESGPPASGRASFFAAQDVFDVPAVIDLCRHARLVPVAANLSRAAGILAIAAGQIMEPGSVAAPASAVRNWAARVRSLAANLRDELGRTPRAQSHAKFHLCMAAFGLVDSRAPACIPLILAAEELAPWSNDDDMHLGLLDAVGRLPAAMALLAAAAAAVEAQTAPQVRAGRRRAPWRGFVHDACRAYEAATGRQAGTASRDGDRPGGPTLRFVMAAATMTRGRQPSLPPLALDFAADVIKQWVRVRRGKTGPSRA
jgi:hypothetical protein